MIWQTTDSSGAGDPAARDYYRVALAIFGRDPVLAAWKLVGDLASALLRPIGVLWVALLSAVALRAGGYGGGGSGELMATIDRVDAPVALGGMAGLVATGWFVGLTLEAAVSGGLYSAIAEELETRGDRGFGRMLGAVGRGFPRVFLLRLIGAAAELTLALLGLAVAIAVATPFVGPADTASWGTFGQALFIAFPAFLFLSLAALVRLLFQVAAAPLFVDEASVGEAIADGARFLIDRLAGVYRLLVFAATLMLVPLIAYWGWLLAANAFGIASPFAPLFTAGRLAGYIVVYAGMSLATALFSASLFAYYGSTTGSFVVRAESTDEEDAVESMDRRAPPYDESTRIEDLLPEADDRIVDAADIPGLQPPDEPSADEPEE